jgi:hypothetical protein
MHNANLATANSTSTISFLARFNNNSKLATATGDHMRSVDLASQQTLTNNECSVETSEATLAKFFDQSVQPLNRILYNLETLSSRLMPSDLHDQFNADSYQQDFLKSNGLSILVSLLKLDRTHNSPKE